MKKLLSALIILFMSIQAEAMHPSASYAKGKLAGWSLAGVKQAFEHLEDMSFSTVIADKTHFGGTDADYNAFVAKQNAAVKRLSARYTLIGYMPFSRGAIYVSKKDPNTLVLVFRKELPEDFVNSIPYFRDASSSWLPLEMQMHSGYYHEFKKIWPGIYTTMYRFAESQGKSLKNMRFVLIGHGFGGGLAQVAALRLGVHTFEQKLSDQVKVMIFGSMRVFNDMLAGYYDCNLALKDNTLRIVHEGDEFAQAISQAGGKKHIGTLLVLGRPIIDERYLHNLEAYRVALGGKFPFAESPGDDALTLGGATGSVVSFFSRCLQMPAQWARRFVVGSSKLIEKTIKPKTALPGGHSAPASSAPSAVGSPASGAGGYHMLYANIAMVVTSPEARKAIKDLHKRTGTKVSG